MPEYQRTHKAELSESLAEEIGLLFSSPRSVAGTFAVAVAGPIERNDTVTLGGFIHETADLHVGDHRPIAVQQYQNRIAAARVDEMQAHSAHRDGLACAWVFAFGAACLLPDIKRARCKPSCGSQQ